MVRQQDPRRHHDRVAHEKEGVPVGEPRSLEGSEGTGSDGVSSEVGDGLVGRFVRWTS